MKISNNYTIIFLLTFVFQLSANTAPIIQPGAPGEESKILDAELASNIAGTSYTLADIKFLQGMIIHHKQAILMSKLAGKRTNNKIILDLANRINVSQVDEIDFMESWLKSKGEMHHKSKHNHHMHIKMSGMASDAQLKKLKNSNATDFDRLFLQLMIAHHDGALEMVDELKKYPGSAYEPLLNEFVSDLINDQGVEIERMNSIAVNLSDDPRAGLSPGLYIADEAILNLELIASLKKPTGFYDSKDLAQKGVEDPTIDLDEEKELTTIEKSRALKSPILDFANTDMAFRDNLLVAGNYHGFNMYKINKNGVPNLISSIVCPGGQGDVSIVGNILIMSVEQTRSRLDCGLQGVSRDASPDRFRGIRIFDITDLENPIQVAAVQTCRGSHTHSVLEGPTEDNKIISYNSGSASKRDEEEKKNRN